MTASVMKVPSKIRLDQLLVERGLAETRQRAQALILAGNVRVHGQKSDKPGRTVAADAQVELTERMRYVSRGGLKLDAALDHFKIHLNNRVCLDVRATTSGVPD